MFALQRSHIHQFFWRGIKVLKPGALQGENDSAPLPQPVTVADGRPVNAGSYALQWLGVTLRNWQKYLVLWLGVHLARF